MYEIKQEDRLEHAVLGGLDLGTYDAEVSMDELKELASTAGAQTVVTFIQPRPAPDAAYFFGEGKLQEIKDYIDMYRDDPEDHIDLFIVDDELKPYQQRNIEQFLKVDVVDRTNLILDIFAQRARTREGKLQVELAQRQYRLPRIAGQGTSLSRLGGGIGTRGPGESKLESDRRHIMRRITAIKRELDAVDKRRTTARSARSKRGVETVVLVGYTNAGKSTLMNRLTDAGVLVENKLFATLDPTSRALKLPSGREVMLIDTVGLVRRLPHELVDAFKSTLEEAASADLILNVCDASSPECEEHLKVTEDLLIQLGANGKPVLPVMNKYDMVEDSNAVPSPSGNVRISALRGTGIDDLLDAIDEGLPKDRLRRTFLFPFTDLSAADEVRKDGTVFSEEYVADGLLMDVLCSIKYTGKYESYIQEKEI